jgi:SulP family sulfate permease
MQKRGVRVMLCEANERVKEKLNNSGVLALVGKQHYFEGFGEALAASRL